MAGPSNPSTAMYDAPTKFTDGVDMPAGTITKYQLGLGQTSGTYTVIRDDADFTVVQGKQATQFTLTGLAFGQWFGAVRAVSKDGPVSAWSNELPFTVDAKTPEKPVNFTIG